MPPPVFPHCPRLHAPPRSSRRPPHTSSGCLPPRREQHFHHSERQAASSLERPSVFSVHSRDCLPPLETRGHQIDTPCATIRRLHTSLLFHTLVAALVLQWSSPSSPPRSGPRCARSK